MLLKKLNNRGLTTIEVLVCFVLIVIMTISMYDVISSYNERRILEGYKLKVTNYKNLLTKEIQDDLILKELIGANSERQVDSSMVTYTVSMYFNDGSSKQLVVKQQLAQSSYHPAGSPSVNDEFMILYGEPNDLVEYQLPDLGSYEEEGRTIQNLSINNVLIDIKNDNTLSIYIGFYHPELGTHYAIDIVAPINFSFEAI